MMYAPLAGLVLALPAVYASLEIVHPSEGTTWYSAGTNVVEWTSTDASEVTYFDIQLLHNDNATFTAVADVIDSNGIFAKNISSALGFYLFQPLCTYGNVVLPTGDGFTVKLLTSQSSRSDEDVRYELAISNGTFGIVEATPSVCNISTGVTSITSPTSTSSDGPVYENKAGAISGSVLGGLMLCGVIAGAAVLLMRRRRRQKTRDFEHRLMSPGSTFKGGFVPLEERRGGHDRKRSDFGVGWQ